MANNSTSGCILVSIIGFLIILVNTCISNINHLASKVILTILTLMIASIIIFYIKNWKKLSEQDQENEDKKIETDRLQIEENELEEKRKKHRYEEKIDLSGFDVIVTLHVEYDKWKIRFSFPGPDSRYKWAYFNLNGNEMDSYRKAYKENWDEYKKLKANYKLSGSYSIDGKEGMSINIGGYNEGVCIDSYHLPINTQESLKSILSMFNSCKKKAEIVFEMFRKEEEN
jgi:hypothetical protein